MIRTETIRGRLIAAVPTPFDAAGDLHREGLRRLVSTLAGTGIGGVAVGTPLGRGPRLSPDQWAEVVSAWRAGLDRKSLLIASVGASPAVRRPPEVFDATLAMARRAAELGADALLVQPPGAVRGRPERDRLVLEYHSAVAEAGLPLLFSYRREVSGGISYGPDVLAQLLARPEVLGVEIATIDGIATFQQVEALARELAPGKLVVSGEERFLGYSLMCGADSALVGLASAFPSIVLELLDAHAEGEADRFLKLSTQVDALARPIFQIPLEASPLRLLWALVHLGVIPPEAANDPWGAKPGRADFDRLGRMIAALDLPTS
jgi:4-hydroxy-tetrahydrodipicolinate synthase